MPSVTVKITDKDFGFDKIMRKAKRFRKGITTTAGIQGNKANRIKNTDPERSSTANRKVTNAQAAYWNEYGTERFGFHIPERSFLRATYDKNEKKYIRLIGVAMAKELVGRGNEIKLSNINNVGKIYIGDVVKLINKRIPPKNKDRTLAYKRHRSTTPLIDFGQMIKSFTSNTIFGFRKDLD